MERLAVLVRFACAIFSSLPRSRAIDSQCFFCHSGLRGRGEEMDGSFAVFDEDSLDTLLCATSLSVGPLIFTSGLVRGLFTIPQLTDRRVFTLLY